MRIQPEAVGTLDTLQPPTTWNLAESTDTPEKKEEEPGLNGTLPDSPVVYKLARACVPASPHIIPLFSLLFSG